MRTNSSSTVISSGVGSLSNTKPQNRSIAPNPRAGLPYPKTLHPVRGRPILHRILALLADYDPCPTIIVAPDGQAPIVASGAKGHWVVQESPDGMGDAVLHFERSPAAGAEHVLLIWGDIPLIGAATVRTMVDRHFEGANDFTFVTRKVGSAYTCVERDREGRVLGITESREQGIARPGPGERDIGLFLFRAAPVLAALREDLPGRFGAASGEHGFLYVIAHLVARGLRVEALPVATAEDIISLNHLSDLDGV